MAITVNILDSVQIIGAILACIMNEPDGTDDCAENGVTHAIRTRSLVFGLFKGFTTLRDGTPTGERPESVETAPTWYRIGYIAGTLLAVLVVISMATYGAGVLTA